MKLERNVLRSVIFGLGLSKESLEIKPDHIVQQGLQHRLAFWRIDAIRRKVWMKDIHAAGSRTAVYPILFILAAISFINVAANLFGFQWWWALQIWKAPFGFVLNLIFSMLFRSEGHWLSAHIISLLIYLILAWVTRRRTIRIEYGAHRPLDFPVHGIPKEQVDQFVEELEAQWMAIKRGESRTLRHTFIPSPPVDEAHGNQDQFSGRDEKTSTSLSTNEISEVIKNASMQSLGVKEHQMESSILQELRVPQGELDDFLHGLEVRYGLFFSPQDRNNIQSVADIIRIALKSKK